MEIKCNEYSPIKIYGVTTVGPKGQIIIPRETRRDFDIDVGDKFFIASIERIAFGIGKIKNYDFKKENMIVEDYGKIQIGSKYQFVIPSEVRKILKIETGNSLVLIGKQGNGIGFIKNDNIDFVFQFIKAQLIDKV